MFFSYLILQLISAVIGIVIILSISFMASCFLILQLGVEMSPHVEYWTVLHFVSSTFRDVEFF